MQARRSLCCLALTSTASPHCRSRWETCRQRSHLQGVGRLPSAQTCPCLELAADRSRVISTSTRRAPILGRSTLRRCIRRHRTPALQPAARLKATGGIRQTALISQVLQGGCRWQMQRHGSAVSSISFLLGIRMPGHPPADQGTKAKTFTDSAKSRGVKCRRASADPVHLGDLVTVHESVRGHARFLLVGLVE